ncbi:hypothetical protein SUNI508_06415 [Seiridium unicorne]|uniref:Uncharacterized protein n=1 Tax=Seiridium unicorne TaxID=138068 RepID=A0ABR2V1G1_9PEZI
MIQDAEASEYIGLYCFWRSLATADGHHHLTTTRGLFGSITCMLSFMDEW